MRTRGKILGAFLGALSLVAALTAAPSPALADGAQINVSVPEAVPCFVKHDGTVIAPSNWEIKNEGTEEVSLGAVSVTPSDEEISLSAKSSVADDAKSEWFSYKNRSFAQVKTGEKLAPGASVSVDWSVGKLDATTNASTLEAAANGTFALAKVDFSFGQKQAFAVRFEDGTAGLYKRLEAPNVGDTFDDRKVAKVVTGIENKTELFENDSGVTSVKAVDEGIRPSTTSRWFYQCHRLKSVDLSGLDTSGLTNMSEMFYECVNLSSLDLSRWDTSRVTTMHNTFCGCLSLPSLDVSGWVTSSVTNMSGTFKDCDKLTLLQVSGWDVSNVTAMNEMFAYDGSLVTLDVSNWNVSNVTSMSEMFQSCNSLSKIDVKDWDTSKVTDMNHMFSQCHSLLKLETSEWNVSNVTAMNEMFAYDRSLVTLDVLNWNVSNVTNMYRMFINCSALPKLDVLNWNVSKVTTTGDMFSGCSSLATLDV